MSVPQAMEWLIEHAEDPTIDTPLPGQASPGEAGAAAEAGARSSEGDEEARDELTEIFKKIRRKREFRADARVRVPGPRSSRGGLLLPDSGRIAAAAPLTLPGAGPGGRQLGEAGGPGRGPQV